MKLIEAALRDTMGLDAATIGSGLIHRTVRLRMKTLGLKRIEEYRQLLASSRAEWDELVEATVVTETWFFRDRETFAAVTRLVLEEWLPAHPTAPLRILSLPCSSGEEPYSLAMALLEAGVPSGRFQIDAADISERALARAREGRYRKNSFRGENLEFRDRYFLSGREGFLLKPELRAGVNFYQGNLLTDDFFADKGTYDFIFCRNLLIYFDRPTQQRALHRVKKLLAPTGVLFVGPAELPLVLDHGLVSAGIPMAFACRKSNGTATAKSTARSRSAAPSISPPALANRINPNGRAAGAALPFPVSTASHHPSAGLTANGARSSSGNGAPKDAVASLKVARRLADAGRLKEAAAICENHLREHGASVEAYYLLGLVLDAESDPKAIEYYRKALYLEPDHYETLLQMAVLSQRNGDGVRAERYKRRAKRAAPAYKLEI